MYLAHPGILGRFLRSVDGGVAVDLGCGPGNLLPALAAGAQFALGVDISDRSVRLALSGGADSGRGAASVVQADLLRLPLRDGSVEVAVATGSLHHTGDTSRGFAELCRVLRPGGRAFVSLYLRSSYYHSAYRTIGRVARGCSCRPATDLVVNRLVLLPAFWLYFVTGRFAVHRRLRLPSAEEVRNYFADQLLNPVVSFHDETELRRWAEAGRLEIDELVTTHAGALLNVVGRKRAAA